MEIEVPGYTVKHKIADGGMASVYLAVQDSLQRDVALKILAAKTDASFRQRFLNEGRLLASLSHPSVITIYDIGILPDGHGYIAMEYLAGGDLAARLLQPMPVAAALKLLRQLAAAMAVVHDAGIVHRDIKPANILFRGDGTPVLSDFGVARREQQDARLTLDGYTVGSPAYSSPEQLQGRAVDARADIYSLGVTFYQMLTASNPFHAESFADTIVNHLQMPVPALPSSHVLLQPLLDRLLAKEPDARFADCRALIAALDAVQGEASLLVAFDGAAAPVVDDFSAASTQASLQTATAMPMHAATVISPLARPRRRVAAALAFVLVLVLIGVGSAWLVRVVKQHQQVSAQLALAEQRFEQKKYLTPVRDSAVFYYREALLIDAGNRAATAGLQRVAAKYEELARRAFAANRYDRGMALVEKGLQVVPDHAALLQLKKEQQALGHPTSRFFRRLFN